MTKRLTRPLGLLLVLAATIGILAACEPGETEPREQTDAEAAQFKTTIEFTENTWAFDGKTQGAFVSQKQWTTDDNEWGTEDTSPWGDEQNIAPRNSGGSASASGCKSVAAAVKYNSLSGLSIIYRVVQYHYWCWYLATDYNMNLRRDITNIDAAWRYKDVVSSWSRFYIFRGLAHAGYQWYRKFEFEGPCTPFGCLWSLHPWIKFNAHADGTWYFNYSNR